MNLSPEKLINKSKEKIEKYYTVGEEIGNSVSHGVMALFCLIFLPFATLNAYIKSLNSAVTTASPYTYGVSVGIFVLSLSMMFLASTLYHSAQAGTKHKKIMRILDHCCIYVAIAGTYTPIALCIVGGWQGWVIFGIQWGMVLFGVLYKSLLQFRSPKFGLIIYIIMGWSVVMFLPPFLRHSNIVLLSLIFGGGLFYMVGVYFYNSKWKFAHMIWHFMINLASVAHFIAIVFFLIYP